MQIVGWADWAWVLGLLGSLVAGLLYLRSRGVPAGDEAGGETGAVQAAVMAVLGREYLVLAAFVVIVAVLLGLATSVLTGAAYVSGAAAAGLVGLLGARAGARAGRGPDAGGAAGPGSSSGWAGSGASVAGVTALSLAVLCVGAWYLALGSGAITGRDFRVFANAAAGLALGASSVALLARFAGDVWARAVVLAAELVGRSDPPVPARDARNPAGVAARAGAHGIGLAGPAADVLETLLAGVVAALALAASEPLYASSRTQAVTLPLLLIAAGMVAALLAWSAARPGRRAPSATTWRAIELAGLVLFLALAFGVVRALGFDIVDPTGARTYTPDAPFFAILAGTLAGLLVGLVSGRPPRPRLESEPTDAATGIAVLAPGLESVAGPLVLVALAVGVSYYAAGLSGIALAAIGLLMTVGLRAALGAYPSVAATPGPLAAGARGMATAAAALAGVALLAGFVSLAGLESTGQGIVDVRVLLGLLLGAAIPFEVAGRALAAVSRTAAGALDEADRQLSEIRGLRQGRTAPDSAGLVRRSSATALRLALAPVLIVVLAPLAAGVVSLQLLAGVLAGSTLTGALLAWALAGAGDAHVAATQRGAAREGEPEARGVMAGWSGAGAYLAAGPALNSLIKWMGVLALALAPWLVMMHGGAAATQALRQGAHQLLALLGG